MAIPDRRGALRLRGRGYPATRRVLSAARWRGVAVQRCKTIVAYRPHDQQRAARSTDLGCVLCGIGIGFLSGLTGTGGGIFLSPLLLFLGWSATKPASGVAAVFILCNSIAGLLGNVAIVKALPPDLPIYAVSLALGAIVGTTLVIRWGTAMILKALGAVLLIAGLKLIGVY